MARKSRQQIAKLVNKKCYFCDEDDYDVLDTHRILEGANGGTYDNRNTLVVCCKCHRRIHAGQIKIDRKYKTTGPSLWVLHYYEEGVEKWK